MKGSLAWILFTCCAAICLLWIGFGVRDDLREDTVFHDIVSERLDYAKAPDTNIHIGVAGDLTNHEDIFRGVRLAAQEINETGGLLGHTIVLDEQDDKGTIEGSLSVAQQFASDPKVSFVIGHTDFGLTDGVAQNYEFYQLLRFSPNTFGSTRSGFKLLFENGIKPEQISEAILDIATRNKWHRLGLIYTKNKRAMQQARRFESMANKDNIKVPLTFAFKGRGTGISSHMGRWKRELALDAIVLAVDDQDAAGIIMACRAVGLDCPFILLADPTALAKQSKEYLGTVYTIDPPRSDALYLDVAKAYRAKYDTPLTMDALLGFDALQIIRQAIEKTKSFVPSQVAETLRNAPIDQSFSGTTKFDEQGSGLRQQPTFSLF